MKIKVEITEILQKSVEVEASSYEEAILLVKRKYNNSEIILDSDDFVDVEFNITE